MGALAKTRILREDWEVEPRLAELRLEKAKLLRVRDAAIAAAADATAFHPANAAGTFSYHYGTFALRNENVGEEWVVDRRNGVEAIRNVDIKVVVAFANVDVCCNDKRQPEARSDKGAGAESLCADNELFEHLPHYSELPDAEEGFVSYFVMVAPDGAVELSLPHVKNGRFTSYIERLYLSDGSDLKVEPKRSLDDQDAINEFDPKVSRK